MKPRYGLLLMGLLLAPLAAAQHVDTLVIHGTRLPHVRTMPPGAGIDEEMVIRPSDEAVYFIRRYGTAGDSVHAYIRHFSGREPLLFFADSVRTLRDSLLGQRLPLALDSLRGRVRMLMADSAHHLLRRLPADSLPRFYAWTDSSRHRVRHLYRLHADSLRLHGPMRFFEHRRPGARLDFRSNRDVEILEKGDSTVIQLQRPGTPHRRFALPNAERQRPETRPDGVLVVPDGRGGTWVYLPPKEE